MSASCTAVSSVLTGAVAALLVAGMSLSAPSAYADDDEPKLTWDTEGYLRTRSMFLTNMAPQDRRVVSSPGGDLVFPDIRQTSYQTTRLRVMPSLSYGNLVTLRVQIDALDDVLWGDNNAVGAAPLFTTDVSNQYFLGGGVRDSVTVSKAWLEFKVPFGIMRVGRMPSHWGMGLLSNGGGTMNLDPATPAGLPDRKALDYFFDDDFGDNHFGMVVDRVMFLTKPLSIARTLAKKRDTDSNFVIGYAYDKLAEAPFLPSEPYERRARPFGQQGFLSRGGNDDVNEHVVLALYNNPYWNRIRYTDELRVGMYGVVRHQVEGSTQPSALDASQFCGMFEGEPVPCVDTGSLVWIADFWWRVRYGALYTEGELIKIFGETFGGVPFPLANQKKEANITSAVVRAGYLTEGWDALLEAGHASGDEVLTDETFKQRPLHPDYNVGLILFEETLRELSARAYGAGFYFPTSPDGVTGFFSNGGVINANYLHPKFRYRLRGGKYELISALLFAWVDELSDSAPGLFLASETNSKYLGTEIDFAAKVNFSGKMNFSLETGFLQYGGALKSALPNASNSFTLQTRLAFIW